MSNAGHLGGWAAALILVAGGCGGSAETTSVSGTITVRGQPLGGGLVNFFPATGGRPVGSPLDQAGSYEIELPPGSYKVVVQVSTRLPDGWREGDPVPLPPVQVPARFGLPQRTPLTMTVEAGPAMEQSFDLK